MRRSGLIVAMVAVAFGGSVPQPPDPRPSERFRLLCLQKDCDVFTQGNLVVPWRQELRQALRMEVELSPPRVVWRAPADVDLEGRGVALFRVDSKPSCEATRADRTFLLIRWAGVSSALELPHNTATLAATVTVLERGRREGIVVVSGPIWRGGHYICVIELSGSNRPRLVYSGWRAEEPLFPQIEFGATPTIVVPGRSRQRFETRALGVEIRIAGTEQLNSEAR